MSNGIRGGSTGGSIDGVDVTDESGRNVRTNIVGDSHGAALRREIDRPVTVEAPQIRTKI